MNEPKRVLMIGPSLTGVKGGMTSVVEVLMSNWDRQQFELEYIETYIDTPSKPRKLLVFLAAYVNFLGKLLFYRPHIIHIHVSARASYYRKAFFILTGRLFGQRVILHFHASEFHVFYEKETTEWQRSYIRFVMQQLQGMIVLSKQWQEYYGKLYTQNTPHVIYNPVNVPDEIPNIADRPKNNLIVMMGRLGNRKGTYVLLKAIPKILEAHPEAKFWLGGDGDIEQVEAIIKENGWENNIKLLGWVTGDQKHDILSQATILTLPSFNEGLPVAVLEGMAYRLPIVTTPVGGIPEVIRDGKNGLLVEPGDEQQLADAIIQLLEETDFAQKLGEEAYKDILQSFESQGVVDQTFEFYNSLLN